MNKKKSKRVLFYIAISTLLLTLAGVLIKIDFGQDDSSSTKKELESVATLDFTHTYPESSTLYNSEFKVYTRDYNFTWTIKCGSNNGGKWDYVKFGNTGGDSTGSIYTQSLRGYRISKIVFTIDALKEEYINSIYLNVKEKDLVEKVDFSTPKVGENEIDILSTNYNKDYELIFDCKQSSVNGIISVSKVEYFVTI